METGMILAVVAGLVLLVPLAVAAEIVLASKGGKWAGLILPALFGVLAVAVTGWLSRQLFGGWMRMPVTLVLFAVCCLPAAALAVAYLVCRRGEREKADRELRRMEIQDL